MKTIYKSDLPFIIEECVDYIDQCDSKAERTAYQEELNEVCGDFNNLVESGVFHDAIGKVVNKRVSNGHCLAVEVVTEY